MVDLVIRNVNLDLLELQRIGLQKFLNLLCDREDLQDELRRLIGQEAIDSLFGIEAMLNEWSDRRYYKNLKEGCYGGCK